MRFNTPLHAITDLLVGRLGRFQYASKFPAVLGELLTKASQIVKEAWIQKGLSAGDHIVLSNISGALNGMKLRPRQVKTQRYSLEKASGK